IMRMEIPLKFSPEFLENEILSLIDANDWKNSSVRVKFTVFRKEGGYFTPNSLDINYCIAGSLLELPFYLFNTSEYEIELFKDHYINSGLLSTVKTNNRAINVLGGIYAKENNYDNCLLLNERKGVAEALNANIFVVTESTIKTPPISEGGING